MTRRSLILLLSAAATPALSADNVDSAKKAAETWLALVDAGDYAKSWEQAAEFFKSQVTAEQWRAAASKARTPLGALGTRGFAGAHPATSLPGAPDGEYVVIQYKSDFANKKGAVETITPMKDPDGAWRVSGYYIR